MKYSRSRIYQYNKYDFRFQDFYHDSLNSMDTHKRRRNLSINRFSMFLLVHFEKSLLEVNWNRKLSSLYWYKRRTLYFKDNSFLKFAVASPLIPSNLDFYSKNDRSLKTWFIENV